MKGKKRIHPLNCACPFCKAKRGELKGSAHGSFGKHWSDEIKEKNRTANKGANNPMFGKQHTDESKRKNSEKVTARWKDPDYRAKQKRTPAIRQKMSVAHKRLWQNPEYVTKQMKAAHVRQNKSEKYLEQLLQELQPDEWHFVGDGQLIIAGKCPDFVHTSKKLIIELFGDYWHDESEMNPRIQLFEKHGYQTLIIWYEELKQHSILKRKVLEWMEKI